MEKWRKCCYFCTSSGSRHFSWFQSKQPNASSFVEFFNGQNFRFDWRSWTKRYYLPKEKHSFHFWSQLVSCFCQIVLDHWENHQKFVVAIKWNPQGNLFATASYDHSVLIFGNNSSTKPKFDLLKTLHFNANPESIAFHPDSKSLLIAIRESNNLRVVNLENYEIEKFNMNSNLDDHVSFSALHLSFSKTGKYVLVSTDHHRILLYEMGCSSPLRIFYGATNDIYSQPRNCWHPSGKYVYSVRCHLWLLVDSFSAFLDFSRSQNLLLGCSRCQSGWEIVRTFL